MAVIATDTNRLSNLIKKYDAPNNPELFNDVVVVNQAAQTTLKVGTVLGKITASGKYIVAVETAVDGSKVPAAIYIGDSVGLAQDLVVPATTDTNVLVLNRGKVVVSKSMLLLDATYNTQAKLDAAYAALEALGILVEQTV